MKLYLNGHIIDAATATISVHDRGFLFGDGVYEVLLYDAPHFIGARLHWQRLRASLFHIDLLSPLADFNWDEAAQQVMTANPELGKRFGVYVQVTRGIDGERAHVFSGTSKPTVMIMPITTADMSNKIKHGVSATLTDDTRHSHNHIKSIALLDNILLRQQSHNAGDEETLLRRGDAVVEGSASNVFVFNGTQLLTPPTNGSILPGVMRHIFISLAKEAGIEVLEQAPSVDTIFSAQEVMITSSTREIVSIVSIDGRTIGNGIPGDCFHTLRSAYRHAKGRDFWDERFCAFSTESA